MPPPEEIAALRALPASAQVALEGLPGPCWRIYDDGGEPALCPAPIPGRTRSCWLPVDAAEIVKVAAIHGRVTAQRAWEWLFFKGFTPDRLGALRLLASVWGAE